MFSAGRIICQAKHPLKIKVSSDPRGGSHPWQDCASLNSDIGGRGLKAFEKLMYLFPQTYGTFSFVNQMIF